MDLHGEDLRLSGSWADSIIDLNQMPYINFPFQENYGISPILRLDQPASQFIINGDRLGVLGSLSPPAAPVTPGNNWVARDERESAGQCPRGPITICFGSGASEVASTERETAEESAAPAVEFEKTSPPKPKKKKHRPKVVREGKPVRTPKPSTPKPSVNASGKRKYVRKNSAVNPLETPSSGLAEEQGESIERNGDPPVNASGKRKYVRKNSAVNPPETPSSGLAEEQGESRERDGDPPVNASGKRKYVRKNLAVHPPETPLNGIQEERGEFRERNEGPRPVRRRLDFSFEEASQLQPTESKSTTQDPVDSCLTSLDILPAAQIQPSRRELIRWNLKKLARMRNGNLIEWLSHTPPGASLTFETNPGVDFAFPSTSYSVDHSPRDARDVLKKKRTGRARSRISENTEELEKVNPLQKDGPLALSSEREDFLSLESIIQRIKCLEINDQSKSLIETEHESKSLIGAEHQSKSLIETETALVPYTPGGALVPYKSQALKKLRPKVNLDEESIRVWNLLMGKESNNEENKDKEKRWEEERKVFRGRVDSFIAKMHLVQGDRTFSPWKGSVLDSVIGVFLTQNVSDHLSSSAFMAMAAKFPPVAAKVNSEDNSDRCRKPFIVEEVEEIQINEISSSASGLEVNSEEDSSKTDIFSTEAKGPIVDDNLYNLDSNISFMKLLEMASSRSLPELLMLEKENLFNSQRLATPPMEESSKVNGRESKVNSENSVVNGPVSEGSSAQRKKKGPDEGEKIDWDKLRRDACHNGKRRERRRENMDSLNWEAVKNASVNEISTTIKERGMNNMLAARIKDFLARLEREHGSLDLEWLRDVPPDKAKDFLLSIKGLGLKSVECVRLLTLHHLAFPVDTNVGRISVRLGWVPLQPLPESLQLHLLELYPLLETIQKYLWPRLCTLDQRTLYELHYQMITFGKVFCTKSRPNCNACPLRGECRHFASAFASARLALPGPEERSLTTSSSVNPYQLPEIEGNVFNAISSFNSISNGMRVERTSSSVNPYPLPQVEGNVPDAISSFNLINTGTRAESSRRNCEPIIEEPASPEPESPQIQDIEDGFYEDPDEIPLIKLNIEEFSQNLQDYMQENSVDLDSIDFSKAMVMISQETASIPTPKLKNISRLRTEHLVYEIPDSHCLLEGMDRREAEDPSPYLLAIWSPGETTQSVELPESCGGSHNAGQLCDRPTCFSCNSLREAQSQTVRGTILIPCRTAMRGSFPLNGTYFQVNEVFADHDSSLSPINVPRSLIWNLPRRTVYFGTSVPTIFRGLAIQEIQNCFWRGFVCVRGFDRKTRGPRPLIARLHFPASRMNGNKKTAETELE